MRVSEKMRVLDDTKELDEMMGTICWRGDRLVDGMIVVGQDQEGQCKRRCS